MRWANLEKYLSRQLRLLLMRFWTRPTGVNVRNLHWLICQRVRQSSLPPLYAVWPLAG